MKKTIIALTTLAFIGTSLASSGDYGSKKKEKSSKATYKISTKDSTVQWIGSKVTGKHDGKVKIKKGTLDFEGSHLVGGEVVIDMTSITVDDIKNPEYNKELENHLKNDDFFSVKVHKTASLKVKDVQLGKGGQYDVFADLTIKGKTKPINFKLDIDQKGKTVKAKGKITVDRTAYGVKYNSGKFFKKLKLGDKLIHDDFTLNINLKAGK